MDAIFKESLKIKANMSIKTLVSNNQNQPNWKGKLILYENGTVKQVVSGFWTKGKITSV